MVFLVGRKGTSQEDEEDEEQPGKKVANGELSGIENMDVDSFMRGDFIAASDGEESGE